MKRARKWLHYSKVFEYKTDSPSQNIQDLLLDSWNRGLVADELSLTLGISPEDVCVYLGKNKGFKQIHIPIHTLDGSKVNHTPQNKLTWMAQVYISPELAEKKTQIEEFMADKFSQ